MDYFNIIINFTLKLKSHEKFPINVNIQFKTIIINVTYTF